MKKQQPKKQQPKKQQPSVGADPSRDDYEHKQALIEALKKRALEEIGGATPGNKKWLESHVEFIF